MRQYCVYILSNRRCGVFYTGMTNDLERRIFEHQQKLADGFTKSYGVVHLVWRRAWKLKLVDEFNPEWRNPAKEIVA